MHPTVEGTTECQEQSPPGFSKEFFWGVQGVGVEILCSYEKGDEVLQCRQLQEDDGDAYAENEDDRDDYTSDGDGFGDFLRCFSVQEADHLRHDFCKASENKTA